MTKKTNKIDKCGAGQWIMDERRKGTKLRDICSMAKDRYDLDISNAEITMYFKRHKDDEDLISPLHNTDTALQLASEKISLLVTKMEHLEDTAEEMLEEAKKDFYEARKYGDQNPNYKNIMDAIRECRQTIIAMHQLLEDNERPLQIAVYDVKRQTINMICDMSRHLTVDGRTEIEEYLEKRKLIE